MNNSRMMHAQCWRALYKNRNTLSSVSMLQLTVSLNYKLTGRNQQWKLAIYMPYPIRHFF